MAARLRPAKSNTSAASNVAKTAAIMTVDTPEESLRRLRLHLPPGAARPVFPGTVECVVGDPRNDLVDFAGREKLDVTHGHRLHLQLGADLEVNGNENRMAHRAANNGGAMAAHQRRRP